MKIIGKGVRDLQKCHSSRVRVLQKSKILSASLNIMIITYFYLHNLLAVFPVKYDFDIGICILILPGKRMIYIKT